MSSTLSSCSAWSSCHPSRLRMVWRRDAALWSRSQEPRIRSPSPTRKTTPTWSDSEHYHRSWFVPGCGPTTTPRSADVAELLVLDNFEGPGERKTAERLAAELPQSWVVLANRKLPGAE